MNATTFALNTGKRIAKFGYDVGQFKSDLTHAARDARRTARRGFRAAENCMDDVAFAAKRYPFTAMGLTFAVAAGVGVVVGWLVTRKE